jgi:hypothetical protein
MSLPSRMVILAPCAGGVTFIGAAVDIENSPKKSSGALRRRGYVPPGPKC